MGKDRRELSHFGAVGIGPAQDGVKMDHMHSSRDGIRSRRTDSTTFQRIAPGAPFLSQLMGLPTGHTPRLAATAAYAVSARRMVRRLPAGYRTTREA